MKQRVRLCNWCGTTYVQVSRKAGRPALYCSPRCRRRCETARYLSRDYTIVYGPERLEREAG